MKNNRIRAHIFSVNGLAVLCVTAVMALVLLHWLGHHEKQNTISNTERVWSVATMPLQRGNYAPQVILYGQTESNKQATLKSSVTGQVRLVIAKEGQVVKKNQLLIQIDPKDVALIYQLRQAEVDRAKARINSEQTQHQGDITAKQHEEALLALTLREYKRQAELVARRVGTQADLDKSKRAVAQARLQTALRKNRIQDHVNRLHELNAHLKQAETLLEQAHLDVSRAEIKAPFNGRITAVYTAVGNRVEVGEPLVELFATDNVVVRAQIPAQYISSIRQALENNVLLSAKTQIENYSIELQLVRLVGEIERGHGGIDAIFQLKTIPHLPTMGRSVTVQLQLPHQHRIFRVPYSAVHHNTQVYIVKNHRLRAVPIQQLGMTYLTKTKAALLIDSPDLRDGDQVVLTQIPAIRTGLKVKMVNEKE